MPGMASVNVSIEMHYRILDVPCMACAWQYYGVDQPYLRYDYYLFVLIHF